MQRQKAAEGGLRPALDKADQAGTEAPALMAAEFESPRVLGGSVGVIKAQVRLVAMSGA